MTAIKNTIESTELQNKLFSSSAPLVIDVRKKPAFEQSASIIPTARWQDYLQTDIWGQQLSDDTEIVLYCVHGHQVSQAAAALLQSVGKKARYLVGGLPPGRQSMHRQYLYKRLKKLQFTAWLSLDYPSINRVACHWLIRRFINPRASIHWVDEQYSNEISQACMALNFSLNDAASEQFNCADSGGFATLIRQLDSTDPLLSHLVSIVNAATANDYSAVPQAAGLADMF